ncbi:nucleic acid binding protein [Striga asiatica]|uniref:Nucleic acid binding protein n=1 Tax=Striga asiatica TaxID=4170 RepID=A0A5A7RGS5_STRAF|nr:nucleic acid binding protein [Striga asiatica]
MPRANLRKPRPRYVAMSGRGSAGLLGCLSAQAAHDARSAQWWHALLRWPKVVAETNNSRGCHSRRPQRRNLNQELIHQLFTDRDATTILSIKDLDASKPDRLIWAHGPKGNSQFPPHITLC